MGQFSDPVATHPRINEAEMPPRNGNLKNGRFSVKVGKVVDRLANQIAGKPVRISSLHMITLFIRLCLKHGKWPLCPQKSSEHYSECLCSF